MDSEFYNRKAQYGNGYPPKIKLLIHNANNDNDNKTIIFDEIATFEIVTDTHTEKSYCLISINIINNEDLNILLTPKDYYWYELEFEIELRSISTGEDKIFKLPSKTYSNLQVFHSSGTDNNPPYSWLIKFYNK